ncbi:MAG TPA: hypothetical protein VFR39_08015, partial [Burkholderiales bacterium]|nr:hypothetical protein [Burkholderiales bacterium]
IPIMVWGSTLILRLVDRFPVIVYIGAGVLAWTAAKMILHEPIVEARIADMPWVPWAVDAAVIGGVLLSGWLRQRKLKRPGIVFPEAGHDGAGQAREPGVGSEAAKPQPTPAAREHQD